MRRRIESLELEVASLTEQRRFQTQRKEEYKRRAHASEQESVIWRRRTERMRNERDRWERAKMDEELLRNNSDRRALRREIALTNQTNTLRTSVNRLRDRVRYLEGRLARCGEDVDRLLSENARLTRMVPQDGQMIERIRNDNYTLRERIHGLDSDNTTLQRRIGEHEATQLTQLNLINEHRSEIADLKEEVDRMKNEERSARARYQELLQDSLDRERETATRLEMSIDLSFEISADLDNVYGRQAELQEEIDDLVRQASVLSVENDYLTRLDESRTADMEDNTNLPARSIRNNTPRSSSQSSRRISIQADAELAAIDDRIEAAYYGGSEAGNSEHSTTVNRQDESGGGSVEGYELGPVVLRPLQRMTLPSSPDEGVLGAIEGEEQQGEEQQGEEQQGEEI